MAVELTWRPLVSKWPKPETPAWERKSDKWKWAGMKPWLDHLARELDHLKVREALVEVDAAPVNFKRMGAGLFADAQVITCKVMVTFDLPDVGTVVYAADGYRTWQANVHAVGLTLERLRLVDDYGATTAREQYRGFKRLPGAGGTSVEREWTPEEAAAHLVAQDPTYAKFDAVVRRAIESNVLADVAVAKTVALAAVRATHPDTGGNAEAFGEVQRARDILAKHHGAEL